MDYEFTRDDRTYVVKGKESVAWVERDGHTQSAPIVQDLCAEILRLAEESVDRAKEVERHRLRAVNAECAFQVAEREVARTRAQVAEQARTIDRLKMEARSRELSSAAKGLEAGLARMTPDAAAQEQINGLQHLLTRRERALDEVRLQLDAVSAKSRRRKAKIRKLKAEVAALREHPLREAIPNLTEEQADLGRRLWAVLRNHVGYAEDAEQCLRRLVRGPVDEREAVLAYLDGLACKCRTDGDRREATFARAIEHDIRKGAHLTAPASQQEPSPAGESAPE